jgi:hypothetical protein
MEKKLLISISILLILTLIYFLSSTITGRIIYPDSYAYTTAICNETNYCEDYIINCEGNNLKKFTPTGLSIQNNKDWIDERKDKTLCS